MGQGLICRLFESGDVFCRQGFAIHHVAKDGFVGVYVPHVHGQCNRADIARVDVCMKYFGFRKLGGSLHLKCMNNGSSESLSPVAGRYPVSDRGCAIVGGDFAAANELHCCARFVGGIFIAFTAEPVYFGAFDEFQGFAQILRKTVEYRAARFTYGEYITYVMSGYRCKAHELVHLDNHSKTVA